MWHYLKPNHSTRTPSLWTLVCTWDRPAPQRDGEGQSARVLGGGLNWSYQVRQGRPSSVLEWPVISPTQWWCGIYRRTESRRPLWVVLEDASHALEMLGLRTELDAGRIVLRQPASSRRPGQGQQGPREPRHGYIVMETGKVIVSAWTASGRRLWLVDRANWFPQEPAAISAALGCPHREPPGELGSVEDHLAWCAHTLRLMRDCVLGLAREVRERDLGCWRPTAAGLTWSAYRHRYLPAPRAICCHDDPDARRLERASLYGGQTECWWLGLVRPSGRLDGAPEHRPCAPPLRRGPVYHLDLCSAYPSVMRHRPYPCRLLRVRRQVPVDQLRRDMGLMGAVAAVRIHSETDTYPLRREGMTLYGRGEYDTVLAGPELQRALEADHVGIVHEVAYYALAELFTRWVDWIWQLRRETRQGEPPILPLLAKVLGNSLYGYFARRSPEWLDSDAPLGDTEHWGRLVRVDAEGEVHQYRRVGATLQERHERGERDDTLVAISAYTASYLHEEMRRLRQIAGADQVLYQGVDALLVLERGAERLEAAGEVQDKVPGRLRLVERYDTADLWGINDLVLGGERYTAGLPQDVRVGPQGEYTAEVREGPRSCYDRAPDGSYLVTVVEGQLHRHYRHGRVHADGRVEPWTIISCAEG